MSKPAIDTDKVFLNRLAMAEDFPFYAENCLKIRTKGMAIQPLILNKAQLYIHAAAQSQLRRKGMVRKIILKGRQQGASTYVGGRFYWSVTHKRGNRAFILTHNSDATDNLFGMTERFHQNCPAEMRPSTGKSNSKELHFDLLDSGYKVGTARTEGVGRSDTLQLFHGSEVASWENAEEHMGGVGQAVPMMHGTEIWLESTAKGVGNFFHTECYKAIRGQSIFEFIFIPWFWEDGYTLPPEEGFVATQEELLLKDVYKLTDGQLTWRRSKLLEMGEPLFKQEYPSSPQQAFEVSSSNVLIPSLNVQASVGREVAPVPGPVIWGVDPSRFGDDRKMLAKRRTNWLIEPVKEMLAGQNADTLQLAGAIIDEFRQTPDKLKPRRICVDSIGVGAGTADGLRAANLPNCEILDVNVSESPSVKSRFSRLRDELWWTAREWFEGRDVSMQEDEPLQTEISSVIYSYTPAGKIKIEDKKEMKKRLGFSPDAADAFIITFAGTDFQPPAQPNWADTGPAPADTIAGY